MAGRSRRIADVAPVRGGPAGVGVYAASLTRALADRADGGCPTLIGVRAEADARLSRGHLVHDTNAAAPLRSTVPYVLSVDDLSLIRRPQTEQH